MNKKQLSSTYEVPGSMLSIQNVLVTTVYSRKNRWVQRYAHKVNNDLSLWEKDNTSLHH